jgi:hypothetical protein
MASNKTSNTSSSLILAAFLILSILGAVSTIRSEFIGRGGWMAMAYVIVTVIFILVEINIYLLVLSAREAAQQ